MKVREYDYRVIHMIDGSYSIKEVYYYDKIPYLLCEDNGTYGLTYQKLLKEYELIGRAFEKSILEESMFKEMKNYQVSCCNNKCNCMAEINEPLFKDEEGYDHLHGDS